MEEGKGKMEGIRAMGKQACTVKYFSACLVPHVTVTTVRNGIEQQKQQEMMKMIG